MVRDRKIPAQYGDACAKSFSNCPERERSEFASTCYTRAGHRLHRKERLAGLYTYRIFASTCPTQNGASISRYINKAVSRGALTPLLGLLRW